MTDSPYLSIVVPVRNGGDAFRRCLAALQASTYPDFELLVIDDGSEDGSAEAALACGARVLKTQDSRPRAQGTRHKAQGPAAARNFAARAARGEVLYFVDADVAVRPETAGLVAQSFADDPELVAAFGSYDEMPSDPGFISQYKNLFHHYVHQHARTEASTFWAGCGAIRRAAFLALGGFDEASYRRPSIEDIELGYRLARTGAKIRLFKDWQVTHLKRWTLVSLLRTDLFDRGVPWTRLLWRETLAGARAKGARPFLLDLNLQTANRLSVVCIYMLCATLLWAFAYPAALGVAGLIIAVLLWLNRHLYDFFAARRGWPFAIGAALLHWLYYLYNGVSFTLGTLAYLRDGAPRVAPDGSWVREEY
jgi:glycosyltransferase involved in cell wall biosynthesis